MFGKIVFFVLLGLLLFVLWQNIRMPKIKQEGSEPMGPEAETMVQWPVCGVHFAEVDGVWISGTTYCSQECADKAQGAKRD